jgi:hypothetical protein
MHIIVEKYWLKSHTEKQAWSKDHPMPGSPLTDAYCTTTSRKDPCRLTIVVRAYKPSTPEAEALIVNFSPTCIVRPCLKEEGRKEGRKGERKGGEREERRKEGGRRKREGRNE